MTGIRAGLLAAALAATFLVGGTTAADVVTAPAVPPLPHLQTIHGHIADTSGSPVYAAAVSDGNHTVYTDASGAYSIPYVLPGEYYISVWRRDLDHVYSRDVNELDAMKPVDFVVAYASGHPTYPNY